MMETKTLHGALSVVTEQIQEESKKGWRVTAMTTTSLERLTPTFRGEWEAHILVALERKRSDEH